MIIILLEDEKGKKKEEEEWIKRIIGDMMRWDKRDSFVRENFGHDLSERIPTRSPCFLNIYT